MMNTPPDEFSDLDRRLRERPRVAVPPGFAARVLLIARTRGSGMRTRTLAIAASALLMIGIAGGWAANSALHTQPRPIVRNGAGSRFMILIIENMDAKTRATADERARAAAEFSSWIRGFYSEDVVWGGGQLVANDEHTYETGIERTPGAVPAGQQLTGFFVVRANSHEEVAAYARLCPIIPRGGRVIVRQLFGS